MQYLAPLTGSYQRITIEPFQLKIGTAGLQVHKTCIQQNVAIKHEASFFFLFGALSITRLFLEHRTPMVWASQ